MVIYLNNIEKKIERDTLLSSLLQELQQNSGDYAVAVNQDFVPRSDYSALLLKEDDRVELLVPMQGG